jgi:hypothetical protein
MTHLGTPGCPICRQSMLKLHPDYLAWEFFACPAARCDYATMRLRPDAQPRQNATPPTQPLPSDPIASRIVSKREKAEAADEKSPDPDSWTALDLLF